MTDQERLDELNKLIEEEEGFWEDAKLQEPGKSWRMGDSEFMHHCHVEALTRIVETVLGVEEDTMNIVFKEVVLEELRALRQQLKVVRKEMLRQQITGGLPGIIRPEQEI